MTALIFTKGLFFVGNWSAFKYYFEALTGYFICLEEFLCGNVVHCFGIYLMQRLSMPLPSLINNYVNDLLSLLLLGHDCNPF
jgi:hypothetical protein